jgi:phosphoglycerol transferase
VSHDENVFEFVKKVEVVAGPDALVFQLPVVPFPENPPVVNMSDYEHLRGYLHSESLQWSYGGVKGRADSEWQLSLPKDAKSLVAKLKEQGFDAVWIDRRGYEDRGESLLNTLTNSGQALSVASESTYLVLLR